jgi:hypothetical protein
VDTYPLSLDIAANHTLPQRQLVPRLLASPRVDYLMNLLQTCRLGDVIVDTSLICGTAIFTDDQAGERDNLCLLAYVEGVFYAPY